MVYISEEASRLNDELETPTEVFEPKKEEDEEFIREFGDFCENNTFTYISSNPFNNFNEEQVILIAGLLEEESVYFVKESDVGAVKYYYNQKNNPLNYSDVIKKIADNNNILESSIVVIDERFDKYIKEFSYIKDKILIETNLNKKNYLKQILSTITEDEKLRRNSLRLVRIKEETLISLLNKEFF